MAIDQRKLVKEFVLTGKGTAAEVLAWLDHIPVLEAKGKLMPKRMRWAALGVFLLSAILAVVLESGLLVLVGIVAPIGMLISSAFLGWGPVVHERVETLRLALNMLNQDAGKKTRFDVTLRLHAQRQQVSEGPNPRKAGGKQIFYKDSWLSLSGRLGDGTLISESCTDLTRERTKRNPRGKTKRKERHIALLRVQLDYDRARYGDASIAARRLRVAFRPPPAATGAQFKEVKTTDKSIAVKAILTGSPTPASLQAVSEAILLGGYRILNLARRGAVATGGTK